MTRTYVLGFFDYGRPPLTANQRLHWARRMKITRDVRRATETAARLLGIPGLSICDVHLTWFVTTNHRRDADNVVPTLKAMCDGLVDAGIVPDDTPEYMTKHMPTIEKGDTARMELRITGKTAA